MNRYVTFVGVTCLFATLLNASSSWAAQQSPRYASPDRLEERLAKMTDWADQQSPPYASPDRVEERLSKVTESEFPFHAERADSPSQALQATPSDEPTLRSTLSGEGILPEGVVKPSFACEMKIKGRFTTTENVPSGNGTTKWVCWQEGVNTPFDWFMVGRTP